MEGFASYLLACSAIIISPGPATLLIAATSAAFGPASALRLILGLMLSMIVIAALVGSGITALVVSNQTAQVIGALLAGLYMLYLAYRIATAPPLGLKPDRSPPSFFDGIFLNFVNPKAYAAVAALFSGFVLRPDAPQQDALAKGALMLSIMAIGHTGWHGVGILLSRTGTSPTAARTLNRLFAAALVVSVVWAAIIARQG